MKKNESSHRVGDCSGIINVNVNVNINVSVGVDIKLIVEFSRVLYVASHRVTSR